MHTVKAGGEEAELHSFLTLAASHPIPLPLRQEPQVFTEPVRVLRTEKYFSPATIKPCQPTA